MIRYIHFSIDGASQLARVDYLLYDCHIMQPDMPVRHVIFDLSEVLILGLSGFSGSAARELGIRAEISFEMFGGNHLQELLRGNISEEQYISALIEKNGWAPSRSEDIKQLIRANFHHCIPGGIEIARQLSKKYDLTLLSDHAREWVAYITQIHPFIDQIFTQVYFSYQYGKTKRDPALFEMVLEELRTVPGRCLFIDDSERNISVASSVGLRVIQFKNANQLREDLVHLGLL